jgi:hypothetical protein
MSAAKICQGRGQALDAALMALSQFHLLISIPVAIWQLYLEFA